VQDKGLAILGWPVPDIGVPEAKRQPSGDHKLRSIRELKIHMRLTRVTRIATLGQLFAGIDMIARPHQHRSTTQMRQCGVAAVAEIKYDVVAKQPFRPAQLPECALDQQTNEAWPRRTAAVITCLVVARTTVPLAGATTGWPKLGKESSVSESGLHPNLGR
jgi:hypothetical protein